MESSYKCYDCPGGTAQAAHTRSVSASTPYIGTVIGDRPQGRYN